MTTALAAFNAAVNHHAAGRLAAAGPLYRAALAIEPGHAAAWHLAGMLSAQAGPSEEARRRLDRAVRLAPAEAGPLAHLGGVLHGLRRDGEAMAAIRRALARDPAELDALGTLGVLHHAAGGDMAGRWLLRAHGLAPGRVEPLLNLGAVLRDARRFPEALAVLAAAQARDPGRTDTRMAVAVTHLIQGDLPAGFAAFEHRWHRFDAPPWSGEALDGRTILLHAEQGFGDTIQFARYAPLVAARGGRVVLEVHPLLTRLLAPLAGPGVTVTARGETPPAHDLHCPLMSLPRAFGTTLASVPAEPAYLRAEPADLARWAPRLAVAPGLRVGLVWAGNPRHVNDRNRSLRPALLAPLLAVPGVRVFSLQTGDARADLARLPAPGAEDLIDGVADFADTAAILTHLDLVITVDTAVAHLAGALGRPCWVLLPFAPDWRWLLDRTDSPWYPSLRLFRQPRPGDWATPLVMVAAGLRALAARQERSSGPDR